MDGTRHANQRNVIVVVVASTIGSKLNDSGGLFEGTKNHVYAVIDDGAQSRFWTHVNEGSDDYSYKGCYLADDDGRGFIYPLDEYEVLAVWENQTTNQIGIYRWYGTVTDHSCPFEALLDLSDYELNRDPNAFAGAGNLMAFVVHDNDLGADTAIYFGPFKSDLNPWLNSGMNIPLDCVYSTSKLGYYTGDFRSLWMDYWDHGYYRIYASLARSFFDDASCENRNHSKDDELLVRFSFIVERPSAPSGCRRRR